MAAILTINNSPNDMKGRESGMPPKERWEDFFRPTETLALMGIDHTVKDAAEFGCGYGTFAIPAAKAIKGKVFAIDIEADMLEATRSEAKAQGLRNIVLILRDFLAHGTGLENESVDYAMLFNILHVENPERLLHEAWRILRPQGKLGIIHWNYDSSTPRGPAMDICPRSQQCIQWAQESGFSQPRQFDLKPYHYGIVMSK